MITCKYSHKHKEVGILVWIFLFQSGYYPSLFRIMSWPNLTWPWVYDGTNQKFRNILVFLFQRIDSLFFLQEMTFNVNLYNTTRFSSIPNDSFGTGPLSCGTTGSRLSSILYFLSAPFTSLSVHSRFLYIDSLYRPIDFAAELAFWKQSFISLDFSTLAIQNLLVLILKKNISLDYKFEEGAVDEIAVNNDFLRCRIIQTRRNLVVVLTSIMNLKM